MLKHIPFYASLLNKELTEKVKSGTRHVLLYGAIEVHHEGKIGCRASNKTLASECGLSDTKISQYLLEMKQAGWIDYTLSESNKRGAIVPKLEIFVPNRKEVPVDETPAEETPTEATPAEELTDSHNNSDTLSQKRGHPLTNIVAIDNIIDNSLEFSFTREKEKLQTSPKKENKIIFFYLEYKNIVVRTQKEWDKLRPSLYSAVQGLLGYSKVEVEAMFKYADEHYKVWTLHAIAKNASMIIGELTK